MGHHPWIIILFIPILNNWFDAESRSHYSLSINGRVCPEMNALNTLFFAKCVVNQIIIAFISFGLRFG
jgi:hypothetical protein